MGRDILQPGTWKTGQSILNILVSNLGLNEERARELLWQGSIWHGPLRVRDPEYQPQISPKPLALSVWHTQYPIVEYTLDPSLIRYEDQDLLVVWKVPGLNTAQSVYSDFDCLTHGVSKHLQSKGLRYEINTINRLDRDTQGLVLYGKNKKTEKVLYQMFMDRVVHKQYLCITAQDGALQTHYRCEDTLEYEGKALPALTKFRSLGYHPLGTLWLALPVTGRTHQIRKHALRYIQPIIGDGVYGGQEADELKLACVGYRFSHPSTGSLFKIRCLPQWF